MSITRKVLTALVAVSALTVIAPGHAETPTQEGQPVEKKQNFLDDVSTQVSDRLDALVGVLTKPFITFSFNNKDEECLARNIYYEAATEPEEGKVAVGIVTINRVKDGRFAKTICGVVHQRTVFVRNREVAKNEVVQTGWFGRPESVTKKEVVVQQVPVCQFSWVCSGFSRKPKVNDERWEESQRIAKSLLNEGYPLWEAKYENAMYFHSTGVKPVWAHQKGYIGRIGGHKFYEDR